MFKEDHDDPIIEYFDKELERRERRLHEAYRNRNLLEFAHGEDWFIQHVNAIFYEYGWPRVQSNIFDKETLDYMNSPNYIRSCWELDNNYSRED